MADLKTKFLIYVFLLSSSYKLHYTVNIFTDFIILTFFLWRYLSKKSWQIGIRPVEIVLKYLLQWQKMEVWNFLLHSSSDKNKIDRWIHLRNTKNISYNIKIRTFSNFHGIVPDIYDNSHSSGLPHLRLTLIAATRIFEMSPVYEYFSMLNYLAFFFLPGPEQVPSLTMLCKSFLRTYVISFYERTLSTYSWKTCLSAITIRAVDQGIGGILSPSSIKRR